MTDTGSTTAEAPQASNWKKGANTAATMAASDSGPPVGYFGVIVDPDGHNLELTPAYDLCPQVRSGETSAQAMAFDRDGTRDSTFAACLDAAPIYGLTASEAREVIDGQIAVITDDWDEVADLAKLTVAQRNLLWRRQILNPYASYGYTSSD